MNYFVNKTLEVLRNEENNKNWNKLFAGYLKDVLANAVKNKRPFNLVGNLSLYNTISDRNKMIYKLRLNGHIVGEIEIKNNDIILTPKLDKIPDLAEDQNVNWKSAKAREFRKYFIELAKQSDYSGTNKKELFVENSLLKVFNHEVKDNNINNIRPVRLQGGFFQMPTPLAASKHEPTYSSGNRGRIDIMARIKDTENRSRLCVFELKDENKETESQKKAMSQAITYATFIAELLTVQPDWWEFFAEHTEINGKTKRWNKNVIEVVTIMPEGTTETFDNQELEVPGTDITLRCRTLYYNKEKFEAEGKFKFSGSFLNDIKS